MAIILDPVATLGPGTGNGTVPPGITPNEDGSWTGSHIVSTVSLLELTTFLTANVLTIVQPATNIRTPQDASPSIVTYAGLSPDQHDAAIAAGATEFNRRHVIANVFDRGDTSLYEPE